MRVVSVTFVVAVPCPIANPAALAKTKLLNRQSSQHGRAGISLSTAAIQAGELVITGYAPSGRATVSADDRFTTISDQTGRFAFHLAYYPTNCTVTLKSSNFERKAIVENCAASGAQGELGPTGARGELGPPGPQGRRPKSARPSGPSGCARSRGTTRTGRSTRRSRHRRTAGPARTPRSRRPARRGRRCGTTGDGRAARGRRAAWPARRSGSPGRADPEGAADLLGGSDLRGHVRPE
jgi:hypothetical protein